MSVNRREHTEIENRIVPSPEELSDKQTDIYPAVETEGRGEACDLAGIEKVEPSNSLGLEG